MTNLEYYCVNAEPPINYNDNEGINLIMKNNDWVHAWMNSEQESLKDWLLAEYKPYKLTQKRKFLKYFAVFKKVIREEI